MQRGDGRPVNRLSELDDVLSIYPTPAGVVAEQRSRAPCSRSRRKKPKGEGLQSRLPPARPVRNHPLFPRPKVGATRTALGKVGAPVVEHVVRGPRENSMGAARSFSTIGARAKRGSRCGWMNSAQTSAGWFSSSRWRSCTPGCVRSRAEFPIGIVAKDRAGRRTASHQKRSPIGHPPRHSAATARSARQKSAEKRVLFEVPHVNRGYSDGQGAGAQNSGSSKVRTAQMDEWTNSVARLMPGQVALRFSTFQRNYKN